MEINILENVAIDWDDIPFEKATGMTGFVTAKTVKLPTFSIRQLSFSEGYEADHWCEKGHIIYVQSGTLIIAYNNGTHATIPAGSSLILGDNLSSHKAKTEVETQILIID